jgi:Leucine-rich repeat (LRR) protein
VASNLSLNNVNSAINHAKDLMSSTKESLRKANFAKHGTIAPSNTSPTDNTDNSSDLDWIERLNVWADDNQLPDYKRNFDTGGWSGLPRDKYTLLRVKELNLSFIELPYLPEELFELGSLEELNFYNCNLQSIPEEIGKLSKLKKLNLNANKLKSLPSSIGNLQSLDTLLLLNNQINRLPHEIFKLPKLTTLKADGVLAVQYPILKRYNQ